MSQGVPIEFIGVPLSGPDQVWGFSLDVDVFGNAAPEPVALFVKDGDRVLANLVTVVV